MISELQDIFPNLTEAKIWKILLTIKFRYKKYGTIGISRLEATRYGTSERQMYSFIKYLREIDAIRKIRSAQALNGFKCNVYSLSEWFSKGLEKVKEFVKNTFEYINPIYYVKSRYLVVKKGAKLVFKVGGIKYIIALKGRFKNVIYDTYNNCIINPLELG